MQLSKSDRVSMRTAADVLAARLKGNSLEKLLELERRLPAGSLVDLIVGDNTVDRFNAIVDHMRGLVANVVAARSTHDGAHAGRADSRSGRFLAFSPFFSTQDGIAERESQGLFTVTNEPAKAFWVALYVDSASGSGNPWESSRLDAVVLVSWIPEEWLAEVAHAVGEADGSLFWMEV
ncbi:hypothetical protein [Roseateles chitinivorans]|uniref:hypothetical protein n=1 Tax=Roseateles chitinivorans TaxID=2917965 RepID=UPI003D66AFDF